MFAVIFIVGLVAVAYGAAAMFNVGGAADGLAEFYSGLPRWYPKAGSDRPKVIRAGGAVSLGFGVALVLVDVLRFR